MPKRLRNGLIFIAIGAAIGFVAGHFLQIPYVGIFIGLVIGFSLCLGSRLWGDT